MVDWCSPLQDRVIIHHGRGHMRSRARNFHRFALAAGLIALLIGIAAQLAPVAQADPAPRGKYRAGGQAEVPTDLLREIVRTTGEQRSPKELSCWQFTTYGDDEAMACHERPGDDLWVLDQNDNGRQFRVHVETSDHHDLYCADDTTGWTECDVDHPLGSSIRMQGYFPPYVAGMHWPWSTWLSESS